MTSNKTDKARFGWMKKAASVLLALVLWQALTLFPTLSVLLASPLQVLQRLSVMWRESGFFHSLWFTFSHIVGGFLISTLIAIVLAVLAGRWKWLEILFSPYMMTVKSVPVASFVVIVLIFFSPENLSVIIAALMVLPIVYTNTLSGIRAADRQLEEMAQVYHLPFFRRLIYVRLPQIKPYFLSGVSVALGLCWKAGVAAELIGIPTGSVGEALYRSKVYLDTADLFAWTALVVFISFAFEKAVLYGLFFLFGRGEHIR